LRKKIVPVIFLALLLFAGIIALTQESDEFDPVSKPESALQEEDEDSGTPGEDFSRDYEFAREVPEWVKPARWFRSNAGGMALEEIPSRYAALRNEYALVIDFIDSEELPEYLLSYYDDRYFIEIRRLYEHGEEVRMQWIFRDTNGTTRLIAVFSEPEHDGAGGIEEVKNSGESEGGNNEIDSIALESNDGNNQENKKTNDKKRGGFIEIFDENAFLVSEFIFSDGEISKTDYNYKDGYIVSVAAFKWEENEESGEFTETHTDFFRYNRSSFLRAIERIFYNDRQISPIDASVKIAFPNNILNAARNDFFMSEKLNPYPEFFGDLYVNANSRIVFTTDERGRVLTQTLLGSEDKVVWVIRNTWSEDRIVSSSKTEGDMEFLAEYEYDSNGNRIIERNIRNGILERLVRSEGNKDIEQLYFNNAVVLQAVWEDGRKISETRISN